MRQSIGDRRFRETSFPGPRGSALSLTEAGDVHGRSGILSLLKIGFPLAIVWGVWAVVIFSPQRVSGAGLFTHIGNEICEAARSAPAFTNKNAPSSIVSVAPVISIGAASVDVCPRSEFRRSLALGGMSMRKICCIQPFLVKASTRLGMTTSQMPNANDGFIPAITSAKPIRQMTPAMVNFDGNKATETITCEINEFRHNAVDLDLSRRGKFNRTAHHSDEGAFRGIPLSGVQNISALSQSVNT